MATTKIQTGWNDGQIAQLCTQNQYGKSLSTTFKRKFATFKPDKSGHYSKKIWRAGTKKRNRK